MGHYKQLLMLYGFKEFFAEVDMYCIHLGYVLAELERLETAVEHEFKRLEQRCNPEHSDEGVVWDLAAKNVLGKDTKFGPPFQQTGAIAGYCIIVYHLFERFLEDIARIAKKHQNAANFNLAKFLEYFPQFEKSPQLSKILELGRVANYTKHGRGDSEKRLRRKRPDYFKMQSIPWDGRTLSPLSGYDLEIKRSDFQRYVRSVKSFAKEVCDELAGLKKE